MLRDLVLKNRSYRRFHQDVAVDASTLRALVDLARHCPSGMNLQPLRYMISCAPEQNALIFPQLAWAGYLKDWGGPVEGERPAAYIIILGDREVSTSFAVDEGIAAQTILLGAVEQGLGGCIVGSVRRPALCQALSIPPRYDVLAVLALGRPKEQVVIEAVGPAGDVKYWRDEASVHHVPKRSLDDVLLDFAAK
jgi:nitroreductase